MKTSISNNTLSFQLKGSLLTLTVMQLLQTDSQAFINQLHNIVKKTPTFLKNAPIVIDLEKLADAHESIDFVRIKTELINHGLIPVGVRGGNEQQIIAATAAGIAIFSNSKSEHPKNKTADKNTTSKVITQPVRSGQQVYAGGDLIVIGSVSAGAEVLAEGHIHIYGALRGRALAGINGDTAVRIFCYKLEPELISIAGHFKLHDDIKIPKTDHGLQIYLEEERLQISTI